MISLRILGATVATLSLAIPSNAVTLIDAVGYGPLASSISGNYPDSSGVELTDGVDEVPVWSPSSDINSSQIGPLVGWQFADPSLQFDFGGPVTITSFEVWAADSDGARGVALPSTITLRNDDSSFSETFAVVDSAGAGSTVRLLFSGVNVTADSLIVEASRSTQWTMFTEVRFYGVVPEVSTAGLLVAACGLAGFRRRRLP